MRLGAGHPLQLVLGFTLWLVWFALLYAVQGVGCAVVSPPAQQGPFTLVNAALACLTLVFFAGFCVATVVTARAALRQHGFADSPGGAPSARFVAPAAAVLYGASAVSTLVVGLPVFLLPPCV